MGWNLRYPTSMGHLFISIPLHTGTHATLSPIIIGGSLVHNIDENIHVIFNLYICWLFPGSTKQFQIGSDFFFFIYLSYPTLISNLLHLKCSISPSPQEDHPQGLSHAFEQLSSCSIPTSMNYMVSSVSTHFLMYNISRFFYSYKIYKYKKKYSQKKEWKKPSLSIINHFPTLLESLQRAYALHQPYNHNLTLSFDYDSHSAYFFDIIIHNFQSHLTSPHP